MTWVPNPGRCPGRGLLEPHDWLDVTSIMSTGSEWVCARCPAQAREAEGRTTYPPGAYEVSHDDERYPWRSLR